MRFQIASASLVMALLSSCIPSNDLFPFIDDFREETPNEAIKKCLKANPGVSEYSCDIKNCLASPMTLLAVQELLVEVDDALKKAGIDYWVDSGSAIGAYRGFLLPWDDDVDLGVLRKNFSANKRKQLRSLLEEKGFTFNIHTIPEFVTRWRGLDGLYQVGYQKNRFLALLLKYKPTISPYDAENLWLRYDANGRHFPQLDIFEFIEPKPGKITYAATMFSEGQFKGQLLDKNKIIGGGKTTILGKSYPAIKDLSHYFKVAYGTDEIKTDVVIFQDHKPRCQKLRFKNIEEHKELLDYMFRYLKFVFPKEFDIEAARKSYGIAK